MNKIKKLSPHEAHKIAAGEVVERPANVVKELIENALDAGATAITLFVEDGGKQLIRVVDNGSGMSYDDALTCFEHHATSKIHSVDELISIITFGFRGEALSSIASVSAVILSTKEHDAELGTQVIINQGTLEAHAPISCISGTDISIRNLFDNLPARKKFLKTKETEWRQIVTLFEAMALCHTSVHFKLFSEGKLLSNCPPTASLQERITQLWQHTHAEQMIVVTPTTHAGVTIRGAISSHQHMRYDRTNILFFVNGRWVKHQKLISALLKGYHNVLPAGKFPSACIFIELDGAHVDINIHPRKEEVQFLHPRIVEQQISALAKKTLEQHLTHQLKGQLQNQETVAVPVDPFEHLMAGHSNNVTPLSRPFEALQPFDMPFMMSASPASVIHPSIARVTPQVIKAASEAVSVATPALETQHAIHQIQISIDVEIEEFRIIGYYHNTYILIEREDGLFIVDQHAAHERVLYETYAHKFESIPTITLIFPQIINLNAHETATIEAHLDLLTSNGIRADFLGEHQLVISATPMHIKHSNIVELIKEFISWLHEENSSAPDQFKKNMHEKLHAQMACKAAVKAGDQLSKETMQQLITDLSKSSNRFSCPHGRPTGWLLSLNEIEKKFKRKL